MRESVTMSLVIPVFVMATFKFLKIYTIDIRAVYFFVSIYTQTYVISFVDLIIAPYNFYIYTIRLQFYILRSTSNNTLYVFISVSAFLSNEGFKTNGKIMIRILD